MANQLTSRMLRAAQLDVSLYEEVEADRGATLQALLVVVLSSMAAGLGAIGDLPGFGVLGLSIATLAALVGWVVWALLTYFIGTKLLPGPDTKADVGELLRTTGFSSAPGVIRVLGLVPVVGRLFFYAAAVWMLVAMVVAVRQALDYRSTPRALAVCILGWIVSLAIGWLVSGSPLNGLSR